MGSGYASGISSLDHFFPGFVFEKNVIEGIAPSGVSQSKYPASTFFPGLGSRSICELRERKLRSGSIQPVQERWDRRQRYRRRHRGPQCNNRLSDRTLIGLRNIVGIFGVKTDGREVPREQHFSDNFDERIIITQLGECYWRPLVIYAGGT